MMGSWKSTIGKKLAQNMDMKFVDTDDAIEKIMSMKINEIFKKFGENRFREMESSYFIEKSKNRGYLFSTGGGIVLNKNNRNVLSNTGITILLEASIDELKRRIKNTSKRPLLSNLNNIEEELENIWEKRKRFYYSSADYIVKTDNLTPKIVLSKIIDIINENYKS